MKVDKFCEFDSIKKYFKPLTPYGKNFKENMDIITDENILIRRYDAIDLLKDFKKKKRNSYDKIKYYLKNITYIIPSKTPTDIADIFIIKKFINNYYNVFLVLTPTLKDFFKFKWEIEELYRYLNPDGVSDNFYISDSYSLELKKIRQELASVVEKIAKIREEFKREILKRFDISLNGDFVVVNSNKLSKFSQLDNFFSIDVYDSEKVILKPRYDNNYFELLKKREDIISNIRTIESKIIKNIISMINKDFQKIVSYIEPIFDLDIAIACVDMTEELRLKRPSINSSCNIVIKNGIFIPLKLMLDEIRVPYTPLTFTFNKRINIIQGSNMGGKTVVLKTLTLLQYMAQCGFFVPADDFKTLVFKKISVPIADEEIKGLSSFAYEIYKMSLEIEDIKKGDSILIIADEFAKTTNFIEAVAIINALLDYFSNRDNVYFFLSTHFSGIKKNQNTAFLRMKGFNRERYLKFSTSEKKDIKDKIKFINRFMDYDVLKVSNSNIISSDAIDIAKIIGMSDEVCNRAKKYLEGDYEKQK